MRVSLFPRWMCYFPCSPGCCGAPSPNLHIPAISRPRESISVQRAVTPMAHVLLTDSSAGASWWEWGCTGRCVHAELEQVILLCQVLSGPSPGTAPLFAGWLATCDWFSLCLITAGDTPLLFIVCTNL